MRSTEEHVSKLIAERHSDVRSKLDILLNAFATNVPDNVHTANANLERALNALGSVVAREDWPLWLSDLLVNTFNYRTNHANGIATWIAHLRSIIAHASSVDSHVWFVENDPIPVFDVDLLILTARSEFKIDELFDRVVETLRALSSCEEIDSAKAIHDLEEIIRILQRAKAGTFTAEYASWQFVRRFVPNLISAYLKRSDVTGPMIEAFEQTANELDMNLDKAKDQLSERMLDAAKSNLKSTAFQAISASEIIALPDA